jgi:hypothetical protein
LPKVLETGWYKWYDICRYSVDRGLPSTEWFYFFLSWWDWDLNSGLCIYKAGALLLEPHLKFILLWLFWRWSLLNYLLGLASNSDLSNLSLPSS